MSLTTLLVAVAAVAGTWGIVAGILIFEVLRRRGQTASLLWIRLFLPVYVHRYAVITRDETGKKGPLFYHFVIAFNIALIAALLALALTIV